ncbi:hypothetical protein [Sulfurihydrogenibium azorense]|jgi:hypothetical protein|uniref:hypothetical protein n=1 Tax=Sulfurihydrogenibium azorense TaxID=309806 RepID=UPI002409015F|nr:hypothetical protein [Sulfurihydrogenibium azorense]MDM7273592.1 hypothetical protein [Sulfurihydrogenibium azorense]
MKTKRSYYPVDPTPTVKSKDSEWWIATDIQKEVIKRTKKYISLIMIGKIAKQYNLFQKTSYGFKLYHKDLVKIIVKNLTK